MSQAVELVNLITHYHDVWHVCSVFVLNEKFSLPPSQLLAKKNKGKDFYSTLLSTAIIAIN